MMYPLLPPQWPLLVPTPDTTAQDVLDTVVEHLRRQGRPSLNGDGTCTNRGVDGTACAVACLFTEAEVSALGGASWQSIFNPETNRLVGGPPSLARLAPFGGLLYRLQSAHDGTSGLADLNERLVEIAERYGLRAPAPLNSWNSWSPE